MGFASDFVSGATELPRELAGGIATGLGADPTKTKNFLGLDNPDDGQGLWEQLTSHPGQVLGELSTFAFLPLRIFGTAAKAARVGKAVERIAGKGAGRVAKATADIANQAATFGTYGAAQEAADAALQDREAHPVQAFTQDALFTAGIFGAFKGAMLATRGIKNVALKNKKIKEFLLEMPNIHPEDAKTFANASPATKLSMLRKLEDTGRAAVIALHNTGKDVLTSVQLNPAKRLSDNFGETIAKTAEKSQTERPTIPVKTSKTSPIAQEARKPIEQIRAAADDSEAHVTKIANRIHAFQLSLKEVLPTEEANLRVLRALDGEPMLLTADEKQVKDAIRKVLNDTGVVGLNERLFKGLRKEYLPHLIEDTQTGLPIAEQDVPLLKRQIADFLEKNAQKPKKRAFSSKHGEQRKIDIPLLQIEEATGGRFKPVTTDLNQILELYMADVGRALATRNILKSIDTKMLSAVPRKGWVKVEYPTLMSAYRKQKGLKDSVESLYAHPDFAPSLRLLFAPKNMNEVLNALAFANFTMKRSTIFGSLFHFNALGESALFIGAGGFGAALKGAGAGYLISGANPLGAAVGASMGAGLHVLVRTKDIVTALRHGDEQTKAMYEYASRYVTIKPPRDVGNDEFYQNLHRLQGVVDKYVPQTLGKNINKGISIVQGINKSMDVLLWQRLMAGGKLIVFERELEKALIRNSALPAAEQKTQHELAKKVGQAVDDVFGGQNFRKLAEGVDNAFGRKWAAAAASENGIQFANLAIFAPDWTTSNIRVLAKAFPGIEKDPIARKIYQKYALRAAIYYATIATAIQQMLTGKPIWENDDPTRLDLGDGRTMTFSKQLFEPYNWIKNPAKEASVKQSAIAKLAEEQLLNERYVGAKHPPRIVMPEDNVFTATGKRLKIAGEHFAPIFVQDIGRNGPDSVYGFFGHPIYGHIRYGFKKANGDTGVDI